MPVQTDLLDHLQMLELENYLCSQFLGIYCMCSESFDTVRGASAEPSKDAHELISDDMRFSSMSNQSFCSLCDLHLVLAFVRLVSQRIKLICS